MDFYVDLAVAVLLRLIKDRRGRLRYYPALAKVFLALSQLSEADAEFRKTIDLKAQDH
jgi:hypothetical protein